MRIDDWPRQARGSGCMHDHQGLISCFFKCLFEWVVTMALVKQFFYTGTGQNAKLVMSRADCGYDWERWPRRRKQDFAIRGFEKTGIGGN